MSSKLTELTEYSPSVPPPSVLCGSGIFSWLGSPWSMASSGHFDPSQTYDGYKEVEGYLWGKKDDPFGKEFQVPEAPTPDVTGSRKRDVSRWTNVRRPIYYSSEVPIFRINSQGGVKRRSRISDLPTNPNSEGSDELVGEEVEVVPNSIGHQSSASPSKPSFRRFQSEVIPSTPRNFQPVLSAIPSSIPPPSTSRPPLVSKVRP
ncbi:hypothetical protein O181_033495 [Austropuccinia psidii MF-1]|uniref:Uncharacterized protein n=1 Tax=Austropuccinia psidii MF-1 TaxID=1389203 RepID=A0A9Q3H9A6_9BASI|nr:hypothetical protein [Austropuccinia psidii MF-1]